MRSLSLLALVAVIAGCPTLFPQPGIPPGGGFFPGFGFVTVRSPICDFGEVVVNETATCDVVITNNSGADTGFIVTVDPPFFVEAPEGFVANGTSATITVSIAPTVPGTVEGALFIDVAGTFVTLSVDVLGPPTVNIEVAPRAVVGAAVEVDASFSFSGSGSEFVQHAWRITARPEGSSPFLTNDDQVEAQLYADRAGSYTVEVTILDARGFASTQGADVVVEHPQTFAALFSGDAGAVLHVRPLPEVPCGPLDCFADHCGSLAWANLTPPRQGPLGIVLDDDDGTAGTYRVDVAVPDAGGAAAAGASVRIVGPEGLLAEQLFVEVPAGARWEAFDIVVDVDLNVTAVAVGNIVAGGACSP